MKIKYILGIFFFIVIFLLGRVLCEFFVPDNWDYFVAFILGEITFYITVCFIIKEIDKN